MAPTHLLDKDEKNRWYFTRGKFAGELLDDISSEQKQYLKWLIDEDAGKMSLDARKAIEAALED
jgi:hypothetical protein